MKWKCLQLVVCVSALGWAAVLDLRGSDFIAVPNNLISSEGNDGSRLPFAYLGPVRYQQVFAASQFSALPTGGAYLGRIYFRINCPTYRGWLVTNLQVNFSTTLKAPDELNPIFSENVGSDEMIVFGPRDYIPPGSGSCGTFGHGQELRVDIPFFYNPALGNQLMETRHENISWEFQPMNPDNDFTKWLLDAETVVGDSVSRIAAFSLTTNTAEVVETTGLVVAFGFDPIPTLTNFVTTNAVVITWPTNPRTFGLQWADSLGTITNWQPYTNSYASNSLYGTLTLPSQSLASSMYFRLAWEDGAPIPQSGGSTNSPPP